MMQHQYWVTKKTVLKKLGTKEDECIVASDAELDAKLELFRSISDSCLQLQRVLDQYQERLCILAQEENALGKFLRDAGKNSDASGKHMVSTGKAISYSGQQRLSVRSPLLRLYHEVETFRGRAVSDMRATVSAMEKARIEYRAALSWMKSTSAQLDPDTGRGLDNFRKAQRQVRESKMLFDKLTLDVLQKIDLLAAARCNMFSHVLSNYQGAFVTFATKVAQTLAATADTMSSTPQYEFCILKELSQSLGDDPSKDIVPRDKDQMLFFQDEYKDENPDNGSKTQPKTDNENEKPSIEKEQKASTSLNLIDSDTNCLESEQASANNGTLSDLAGLNMDCGDMPAHFGSFMPSQLLQKHIKLTASHGLLMNIALSEKKNHCEHFLQSSSSSLQGPMAPITSNNNQPHTSPQQQQASKPGSFPVIPKKDDKAAWFKLFAELDPLANPDNLLGSHTNQSHAA